MALYFDSRSIGGYNRVIRTGPWSLFMNTYATTPFDPNTPSGMSGSVFNGQSTFSAPWSGTYTLRVAADDFGSAALSSSSGGNLINVGGFNTDGNTTSRYYTKGDTIFVQWSIGNSTSADDFPQNPTAVAWTLEGPQAPPFPSVSLSASPTTIIQGNCISLSWSASGVGLYSASLTGVSNPGYGGSATVCPSNTTTYTYTVCGERGCSSAFATITVYIPPVINFSLNPTSIIAGQCATLSWSTSGDANTIVWNSGNVNNNNLTSSSIVCPLDTTTYSATVSGLGGTDSDSITLTVYQIPTLSVIVPESLNYGVNGFLEYDSQYCDISLNVKIYYRYATGSPILNTDINLTNASSSQLSASDNQTKVSGIFDLNMQYDDFGPRFVDVVMTATGNGGSISLSREIIINIDETPDNIIVPEKEDAFKSQDPVFAPETEILSELLLIDDIDIPVEIKSNAPIQVDINGQQDWKNLRQL